MTTKNEETLPEDVARWHNTVVAVLNVHAPTEARDRATAALSNLASAAAQVPGLVAELAQRTRERDSEMEERWKVSGLMRGLENRAEGAESERDALKAELAASEEASGMYAERSGRFAEQADRLEKERDALKESLADARQTASEERRLREYAEDESAVSRARLAKSEQEAEAAREQLRDLAAENERLTARVAELERAAGILRERVATLEGMRTSLALDLSKEKARATAAEANARDLSARCEDLARQCREAEQRVTDLTETLERKQMAIYGLMETAAEEAHPALAVLLAEVESILVGLEMAGGDEATLRIRPMDPGLPRTEMTMGSGMVRKLRAAYEAPQAGSPTTPLGLREAVGPFVDVVRVLARYGDPKVDRSGVSPVPDDREVWLKQHGEHVARVNMRHCRALLAAYDAAKGGEVPSQDAEKARRWDAAVERGQELIGCGHPDKEWAARYVLGLDTPPSGPCGGEPHPTCERCGRTFPRSVPHGGEPCDVPLQSAPLTRSPRGELEEAGVDVPALHARMKAHVDRVRASLPPISPFYKDAPLTPESLAAVVEGLVLDWRFSDPVSERSAREVLRRALAGNAPRVLLEERVVGVLRSHAASENVGPPAFDEGWADCVASIASDLGLTLPGGETAPTPQPEGPVSHPAPEYANGVCGPHPVLGEEVVCILPKGHDGGHDDGTCTPTPAAPQVVWEGDGVRVMEDGTWEMFGTIASALAEAKREAESQRRQKCEAFREAKALEDALRRTAEAQRKACADAVLDGPVGKEETRGEMHARVANVPLVTG